MFTPRELQAMYARGENIISAMTKDCKDDLNSSDIIEIAYDLQTGSYVKAMQGDSMRVHKQQYSTEIAKIILSLCQPESILEAGVVEATTLSGVLEGLNIPIDSYGFDLSWSRIAEARKWLSSKGILDTTLCTGNLLNMPFADNSIDVVYTSHSIEPNRGNEKAILQELFRVARKFVVLLEPGYELASIEARNRMDSHGYCRNIPEVAHNLGYKILKHELFPCSANPLNPTAITIIEKNTKQKKPSFTLSCPEFKTNLKTIDGMMFSSEALRVYPIIGGIPCLRVENGIFASKFGL